MVHTFILLKLLLCNGINTSINIDNNLPNLHGKNGMFLPHLWDYIEIAAENLVLEFFSIARKNSTLTNLSKFIC
jgi:hypothetical protein